jgi:hypothetical protein
MCRRQTIQLPLSFCSILPLLSYVPLVWNLTFLLSAWVRKPRLLGAFLLYQQFSALCQHFQTCRPTPSFLVLNPGCAHYPVGVVPGRTRIDAFATWSGFTSSRGKIPPPSRFGWKPLVGWCARHAAYWFRSTALAETVDG